MLATMGAFYDPPEEILHEVIAAVIDSTRSSCWQLSLRLVNRTSSNISALLSLIGIAWARQVQRSCASHILLTEEDCAEDCCDPC
jgi:hypothetical protein